MKPKQPRINVYRCQYGCNTSTVDVDIGVTPFSIKCRSRSRPGRPLDPKLTGPDGECVGTGNSSFYPKGPRPPWIRDPEWEWYKPTEEDLSKMSKREADHYRNHTGELALRPRTKKEPIYHDE
jgi:hypothetical protein